MSAKPAAETASAPKPSLLRVTALLLATVTALISAVTYQEYTNSCVLILPGEAADQCISLERSDTPEARELGLGGRDSMPQDRGMLFVFETSGRHCFWMKDTRIDLDMIWLDEAERVVYAQHRVSPHTYPQTFCPNKDAKYVIELNAGVAEAVGITMGQRIPVR
jgi:uncharacterized membrane protein (UPF0127 family)